MDFFDNRYYRMNKLLMTSIGQWPYQSLKQRQILWVLVHLAIGTVCLVQGLKLLQYWGNIDMMVECMVPMGVQIVACLKSSNCIFNRVKMGQLLELMKKDWAGVENEAELSILKNYAHTGFLLGFSYVVCVFGSLAIYLIVPLTPQIFDIILPLNESRPRQFLYEVEYIIIDEEDHYVSIMIHNYVGSIITILVVVSVDAMLLAYVHHICGMFSILGYRLENIIKDTNIDENRARDIGNEKIYMRIAHCVEFHGQVLEYTRLIETSYSTSFLFQMAASMLMISATGLQVVSHLGDYEQVFRHGQFIMGQLFHLFVNSWPSQMLTDHTFRFRESVYFAKWYRFPLRGRHLLRLALLRSLKPCQMTAGNLYVMSMESFGTVRRFFIINYFHFSKFHAHIDVYELVSGLSRLFSPFPNFHGFSHASFAAEKTTSSLNHRSFIITTCMFTTLITFILMPVVPKLMDVVNPINTSRPLIYPLPLSYGYINVDKYYIPIMIHADCAILIAITTIVAMDTTYTVYVQHACGLFAALGSNEKKFVDTNNTRKMDRATYQAVVDCIEMHQGAIRYEAQWYETTPRSQKLILLMMMRSIEPCKLTAGKFFEMSFTSFSLVCMDVSDNLYFQINKILLIYLGQWPFQKTSHKYLYRMIYVCVMTTGAVSLSLYMIDGWGDLDSVVESTSFCISEAAIVVKFFNYILKEEQIKSLIFRMRSDWKSDILQPHLEVLRKYAMEGKSLTRFYSVYMYMTLTTFILMPLEPILMNVLAPLNASRSLIYPLPMAYGNIDTEKYYIPIMLHADVCMFLGITTVIAMDTMYTVFVQHACGLFASVGDRLQQLMESNENEFVTTMSSIKMENAMYQAVADCIKMHQGAIDFAAAVESVHANVMLPVIGLSVISVSMGGYQVVMHLDQPDEATRYTVYTLAKFFHVFYLSWPGQKLIDHSEQLRDLVYEAKWYEISPRTRKLLLFMMMRSIEPCKLTAGKLYDMSFANFGLVMRTSMSYFTVLTSFR
ncbi:uncharacterized protein [Venturia canescens]|uniref:uncharacterized protein n=1 Tax=Venturia canescens TaxID=32260 RepID=UPI001C9BC695|nr:uncharacterized protein LOC122409678 [Venturia canescens]